MLEIGYLLICLLVMKHGFFLKIETIEVEYAFSLSVIYEGFGQVYDFMWCG